MRISTPEGPYESEANNTFSMSFEIGQEELEVVPFEHDGYSLSFSEPEGVSHKQLIFDNGAVGKEFHDPTPEQPMEASRFLTFLRLDPITKELRSFYKDLEHFHYPLDAMLRTVIYQRLIGLRHTTQLETKLNNSWHDSIPRNLGFREVDGKVEIPDRRTIDHFIWKRLGRTGTNLVLDLMVIELRKYLNRRRIHLGRRIAIDSTPLEGMYRDEDADYNGHYELFMYKVHQATCVDTGLSLAKIVSRANDYDGDYLIPLVRKLQRLGIAVDEIIADHAYGDFNNWARMNVEFGIKTYFNLSKKDTHRYDGDPSRLRKQNNAMWKEPDYVPEADLEYILKFLLSHGVIDQVGAYFRNQWFELKERNPEAWQKIYDKRTTAERFHSHVKEQLGLERNLRVKGIESVEVYTNLFWIAEIAAALTRVQNGIKTPLLRANQRVLC
jgi:hypothetical protein